MTKNVADGTILFEGARIVFRNFAGREGPFNQAGDRNFCVLLDNDVADMLIRDGWNVKTLKPRELDADEEGGVPEGQPYLQVTVKYRGRKGQAVKPPEIILRTTVDGKLKNRTHIGEEEAETLDWVDITNADLIVRPYNWNVGDKGGVAAYLKSMYITTELDVLGAKYADLDQLPARAGGGDPEDDEE